MHRRAVRSHGAWKQAVVCILIWALAVLSAAPAARAAGNGDYHIGPRDILVLIIHAGGEEQKKVEITVSSDGCVNVPFIGQVQAQGRSLADLEATVTEALARDIFVSPEVFISVKEYHSLQFFISGAVRTPGLYEMSSQTTLLELIAKAGGVLPERGGVAFVLRESAESGVRGEDAEALMARKEPIRVDLKELLDQGNMACNMVLSSRDLIYIPPEKSLDLSESSVWVEGEVKNPGVFVYQRGMTALSACIIAGGFDKFAAPNRTRIVRTRNGVQEIIKIDLDDVKEGKHPDVELQPGDRIHVPETYL